MTTPQAQPPACFMDPAAHQLAQAYALACATLDTERVQWAAREAELLGTIEGLRGQVIGLTAQRAAYPPDDTVEGVLCPDS